MWEQLQAILAQAAYRTAESVAAFLPGLLGLVVILLVAFVLAALLRSLVLRGLKTMRFDERAEQLGLGALADWSSVGGPSFVVARMVSWIVIFAGVLAGLSALDAAMPTAFAQTIFAYMPNLLAALLILVVGTVMARFLARSVLIGAVNLHLPSARLLSIGVKWLVLVLTWAMALEHIGIGRQILTLAFGILFGGIVLTLVLAVGLGSKDLVKGALERQAREPGERTDRLTHV
jgi:hypothetical protein